MQYLHKEKYVTNTKQFEIHVYRDNNKNRIHVEVFETDNGNKISGVIHIAHVPMEGKFNLAAPDYDGFEQAISSCKEAAFIYDSIETTISYSENEADVLKDLIRGD